MSDATIKTRISINVQDTVNGEAVHLELLKTFVTVAGEVLEAGERYSSVRAAGAWPDVWVPVPDGEGDAAAEYLVILPRGGQAVVRVAYSDDEQGLGALLSAPCAGEVAAPAGLEFLLRSGERTGALAGAQAFQAAVALPRHVTVNTTIPAGYWAIFPHGMTVEPGVTLDVQPGALVLVLPEHVADAEVLDAHINDATIHYPQSAISITPEQAGADPVGSAATVAGDLTTHAGLTNNPHAVTAAQAGAAAQYLGVTVVPGAYSVTVADNRTLLLTEAGAAVTLPASTDVGMWVAIQPIDGTATLAAGGSGTPPAGTDLDIITGATVTGLVTALYVGSGAWLLTGEYS